ncbi:MAG TPA: signal peptidase II [Candidatus Angelobacter sp.]
MRKYLLLISAVVFALDALTKWLVRQKIPLDGNTDIVPGLFRLTHLENTGAAFSLFADSPGPWAGRFLVLFSLVALVVISVLLWRHGTAINVTTVSLALFLGGTLGNLCDRLVQGKVTDFLDFYIGPHHWPPFNVADSAIVVGALLLAGRVFFARSNPNESR